MFNCCLQSQLTEMQVTESVIQFWQGRWLHRGSGHYKSLLLNICAENVHCNMQSWKCRRLSDFVGIFRMKMNSGVQCGTFKGTERWWVFGGAEVPLHLWKWTPLPTFLSPALVSRVLAISRQSCTVQRRFCAHLGVGDCSPELALP